MPRRSRLAGLGTVLEKAVHCTQSPFFPFRCAVIAISQVQLVAAGECVILAFGYRLFHRLFLCKPLFEGIL